MKERALTAAKWIWLALVLGAAAWYILRNWSVVAGRLRDLHPAQLVLAIACLILTKLLLTEISRRSLRTPRDGPSQPRFKSLFYINGVTQVAKYLPGGIWHFVGKFAYYRGMGLAAGIAGQAMVVENAWLVGSAIAFGIALVSPARLPALPLPVTGLIWMTDNPRLLAGLAGGVWLAILVGIECAFRRRIGEALGRSLMLLVLQAACWSCSGLSLWVILPNAVRPTTWPLALGAFGLAWAGGYLTIFAPGGIGAREAILVVLLAGVVPAADILVLAGVHRLLWTGAELLMGLIAVAGGALGVDWHVDARPPNALLDRLEP